VVLCWGYGIISCIKTKKIWNSNNICGGGELTDIKNKPSRKCHLTERVLSMRGRTINILRVTSKSKRTIRGGGPTAGTCAHEITSPRDRYKYALLAHAPLCNRIATPLLRIVGWASERTIKKYHRKIFVRQCNIIVMFYLYENPERSLFLDSSGSGAWNIKFKYACMYVSAGRR
jgi:hypothetical protein